MKILVTGANGFLASYIIRNLLERKEEVYGMLRSKADVSNIEFLKFKYVYGNITDIDDIEIAVKGMDIIIHSAADTNPAHSSINDYLDINVKASKNLLEAAIRNNCKRIIYVSTANTIDYGNLNQPGIEAGSISALFKKSGYAHSKWIAENMFIEAYRKGKIEVIVVNPTFMIGLNKTSGSSMKIFEYYFKSRVLWVPKGGKNFIYVDDAAKAICTSIYKGKNGQKYLLANANMSYRDFFNLVDEHLGKKTKKIMLPNFILYLLGWVGSLLRFLGYKTTLDYYNALILTVKNYYSSHKAIRQLDLPQTSILYAIGMAINNYKTITTLPKQSIKELSTLQNTTP